MAFDVVVGLVHGLPDTVQVRVDAARAARRDVAAGGILLGHAGPRGRRQRSGQQERRSSDQLHAKSPCNRATIPQCQPRQSSEISTSPAVCVLARLPVTEPELAEGFGDLVGPQIPSHPSRRQERAIGGNRKAGIDQYRDTPFGSGSHDPPRGLDDPRHRRLPIGDLVSIDGPSGSHFVDRDEIPLQ